MAELLEDRIKGVFSSQKVAQVGTGATVRKTVQKTYYYAEEDEEGLIQLQALNEKQVPSGPKTPISKDDLLGHYVPEIEFYNKTVYPAMRELSKTLAKAERHRKLGEIATASFEFGKALTVDEQNIRANFGIGLCYMARGEHEKAKDVLQRIVTLDAAFEAEHKHMFNEFGISLRKGKLYDQAEEYYSKALEITKNDENIYYNLARALFEKGEAAKALVQLDLALSMNPHFEEAVRLKAFIQKKK